jgi:DNA-binding Lrp family transcriptional regulator
VSVLALIEIRTEDVQQVKEQVMEIEYVLAFYELVSKFNVAIMVEVENEQALFEFLALKVRTIPGVKETKTHLIQDGISI